jgi:hypothetical protein
LLHDHLEIPQSYLDEHVFPNGPPPLKALLR